MSKPPEPVDGYHATHALVIHNEDAQTARQIRKVIVEVCQALLRVLRLDEVPSARQLPEPADDELAAGH